MAKTLLTVQEAAVRLKVSKSSVYALIDSGQLACHRIGMRRGTIRVSEQDLDAFLEACHVGVLEQQPSASGRKLKLKHIQL